MGPHTKKGSSPKASKEKPSARKTVAARPKASTLLEKQRHQSTAKHLPLVSRSTPDVKDLTRITQKIVYDNFKDLKDSQVYMMEKEGISLYNRLIRDKVKCDKGDITMGKHYYATLRSLYNDGDDPMGTLTNIDKSEAKDETLCDALADLGKHCSEPAALLAWLQKEELPNRRCSAALMKMVLLLDPYIGPTRCEVLMSILAWAHAVEFPKHMPDLWGLVKSKFDQCLHKSWSLMKSQGVAESAWWASVQPHATAVLPFDAWDRCIKHNKGSWMDRQADLEIVMDSLVGSRMFQLPWTNIQSTVLEILITRSVELMFKDEKKITADVLKKYKQKVSEQLAARGDDLYSSFKLRPVDVSYRGVRFPIVLSSYIDVYTAMVWARLKEIAVLAGSVDPLFCEGDLCSKTEAKWQGELAAELLNETRAARSAMNGFVENKDAATSVEIQAALIKHNRVLSSLDKMWKIEANFFLSQAGETGEHRLQELVLTALPSAGKEVELKKAREEVRRSVEGALYRFVGVSLQRSVSQVLQWLDTMVSGRSPSLPKTAADSFTSKVINSLACFAHATAVDAKGTKTKLTGKEAIDSIFAELEALVASKKKPTLEQLKPLGIFRWLLATEQQAKHKDWITLAMEGVPGSAPKESTGFPTAAASSSSSSSTKTPSRKRKTDTESARDFAESLF